MPVHTILALSACLLDDTRAAQKPVEATDGATASPSPLPEIKVSYRLATDGPLTLLAIGLGTGLSNGQEGFDPKRSPILTCRWCDVRPTGETSLNRLDQWGGNVRWRNGVAASRWSDRLVAPLGVAALAAPLIFRKAAWSERFSETGVVIKSVAFTAALTGIVKVAARRARPFTHDGRAGLAPSTTQSDDNWSFFSGHTSMAFSIVASSRQIAALRGDVKAKRLWTYLGFAAAGTVGYLRIAAGKHYLTDVLGGAVVGTAIGTLTPRESTRGPEISVAPAAGVGLQLTARW